jgi:hypothetical protein
MLEDGFIPKNSNKELHKAINTNDLKYLKLLATYGVLPEDKKDPYDDHIKAYKGVAFVFINNDSIEDIYRESLNLELVEWLAKYDLVKSIHITTALQCYDNIELEWCLERNLVPSRSIITNLYCNFNTIKKNGEEYSIDKIEKLKKYNVLPEKESIDQACLTGSYNLVKMLINEGCQPTQESVNFAMLHNYTKILELLYVKFKLIPNFEEVINLSPHCINIVSITSNTMKYLFEKEGIVPEQKYIDRVFKNITDEYIHDLEWLLEYNFAPSESCIKKILTRDTSNYWIPFVNTQVKKYIQDNICSIIIRNVQGYDNKMKVTLIDRM